MNFWLDGDGKVIVNEDGSPILCNECPCDSECEKQVNARAKELVDAGTHVEVTRAGGSYACPVFENVGGDWVCRRMASGKLVAAMARQSTMPMYLDWGTWRLEMLVYGITLRNVSTGEYITVGCQCNVNYETYECNHTYHQYTGYCIAGEVDVFSVSDISQYDIIYSCQGDPCGLYTVMIVAYATWYGGTMHGEGVIVTSPQQAGGIPSFQAAKRVWVYTDTEGVQRYQMLTCGCYFQYDGDMPEWTSGLSYIEIDGICTSQCQMGDILSAWGTLNGWQVKGEGLLFHKYSNSDVFDYHQQTTCRKCAVAEDAIYHVGCGCGAITKISFTEQQPSSYWHYIEYSGACTCVDYREILSTYPDVFGVTAISMGSNTILRVTSVWQMPSWDPVTGDETYEDYEDISYTHPAGYRPVNSYSYENVDAFLDDRTFVFVITIAQNRMAWGYVSPSGSPTGTSTPSTEYKAIEVMGNWTPFTSHPYIQDYRWTGPQIEWKHSGGWQSTICYSGDPAEKWAKERSERTEADSVCGLNSYDIDAFKEEVSTPVTEPTETIQGEYHYDAEQDKWCGTPTVIKYVDCPYRIQWIDTNHGLITYGNRTPRESVLVHGMSPYVSQPGWSLCCHWSCAYGDDTTITAQKIDSEMHYCHDDFEMPAEE